MARTVRAPVARRLESAALELFAERGYDAVTVDDLAEAGGVGRRTFFRYYPTKLDVVLGELDEGLAALAAVLDADPSPDPVAAARRAFLAVNHYDDDQVPALRRRLALIEQVPDLAARAAARYRGWEQALALDAARRWGPGPWPRDAPGSPVSARRTDVPLRAEVFSRSAVAAMRGVFGVWLADPAAGPAELAMLVDEAFALLGSGLS